MAAIKVLVVDDSAVVRQVLGRILSADPAFEVMAAASDPIIAMERMKKAWPDVIVLDIEMPRMDGITFLKKIMSERPTPVVICSSLTESGARTTLDAMVAGAVAVVVKPKLGIKDFLLGGSHDLVATVKEAARANVKGHVARITPRKTTPIMTVQRTTGGIKTMPRTSGGIKTTPRTTGGMKPVPAKLTADVILPAGDGGALVMTTERIVAIGTSAGGTQALHVVLSALPRVCPGIVVVQHMPPQFTAAFAARLDSLCEITVKEAHSGDRVVRGTALIAPGGKHMLLKRSGAQYHVDVVAGPLVNRHRPSVDVLFRSAARCAGSNALGIIMTGMGDDGAAGLLEMRKAGARTVAQDEETCVVYGMPKEAVRRGAVDRILPLEAIRHEIMQQLSS
jgi:two-component system chemotaxis response regulator CheB